MRTTDHLTRGELARQSEVHLETLRYYEQRGLLPRPPRSRGNHRLYPLDSVRRVRFIKRAKQLGFTLEEIRTLLSLRARSGADCGEVLALAEARLRDLAARIRTLQAMAAGLRRLARVCKGRGPVCDCPILDALDGGEEA